MGYRANQIYWPVSIIGDFKQDEFVPLKNDTGHIPGNDGETVLGLWAKGAANPKLGYTPEVLLTDASVQRVGLLAALEVGMVPAILLLHHARRLFGCFWRGEVFASASVSHIRAAGFWLVVSALTAMVTKIGIYSTHGIKADVELDMRSLLFGIGTFIAAYVMEEARRIADENASIL